MVVHGGGVGVGGGGGWQAEEAASAHAPGLHAAPSRGPGPPGAVHASAPGALVLQLRCAALRAV